MDVDWNVIRQRFWQKVQKDPNGCWVWQGMKTRKGYGVVMVCRRPKPVVIRAHRFSWEEDGRELPPYRPDGLQLDHRCKNPSCVNPDHLELVPPRVNILRGESPAAENARKMVCPKGHRYEGRNVIYSKKGRLCRLCQNAVQREKGKRRREAQRVLRGPRLPRALKTHCRRGHRLEGENVYSPPHDPTHRYCRECKLASKRRWYASRHPAESLEEVA